MELPRQDEIKHQKSRAVLSAKPTVNLVNLFQKAKTTHNRNEKKANNGIRVANIAILFSVGDDVVICEMQ